MEIDVGFQLQPAMISYDIRSAYSPMMGDMLTFHQSKSTEYVWMTQREYTYPDENFAREIMQLFTMGTKLLNNDGTSVLDSDGNEISVYSNVNIVEFSRAWTGFGM